MLRRRLFLGLFALAAMAAGAAAQSLTVSSLSAPVNQSTLDAAMDQRIQGASVTLNASGVATWTYPYAYSASPIVSYLAVGDGGSYPVQCNLTSVSATAAVIKCYKGAPVTVSILGAVVNAFQGSVTGTVVHLHARPLTT